MEDMISFVLFQGDAQVQKQWLREIKVSKHWHGFTWKMAVINSVCIDKLAGAWPSEVYVD